MKLFLWTVVFSLATTQICSQGSSIKRVGNQINASNSGADWAKTVFLLHDTALADGIVFAFSAYFRNSNRVHFQIWRKATPATNNFTLVHEWPFSPVVSGGREDIYIQTRQDYECIRVKKDDRLGLYFEDKPGSVSYTFQPDSTQTYQYIVKNGTTRPRPGSSVLFDTLVYPYTFSAAAYIDTDMTKYTVNANGEVTCPTNLAIPLDTPSTGAAGGAGATGATGPRGAVGATGPKGDAGDQGLMGLMGLQGRTGAPGSAGGEGATGATGPAGKDGKMGATGLQGQEGPPGPAGTNAKPGANAMAAMFSECSWCKNLLNPYLILGLVIWLTLVTLLLVTVICCVTCRRREKATYKDNKWAGSQNDLWKRYEGTNGAAAKVPSYENPTMEPTYDAIEEGRTAF